MRTVLHLLAGGGTGGIEVLCKDYATYSKHNNIFVFFWNSGNITEEIKKNGNTVIELNAKKKDYCIALFRLSKIIKKHKVDVFIVHHASPILHIYMYVLGKLNKNMKTVAYAHGLAEVMYRKDEKKGRNARKKALQFSLKKADAVVAVSNSVKNSLIKEYDVYSENIYVIYNGVDLLKFKPNDKEVFFTNDKVRLIYVGRLIKNKGVQLILSAIAKSRNLNRIHFTIVGEGDYREDLEELSRKICIENQVSFLGISRNVYNLLPKADIFLHVPMLEEGFGITVIEAMASGLICVCSRSGALPEIVINEYNGFLVEKNSIEEITKCIDKIVDMKIQDLNFMRQNAIKQAENFSTEQFVNSLDFLIEEV